MPQRKCHRAGLHLDAMSRPAGGFQMTLGKCVMVVVMDNFQIRLPSNHSRGLGDARSPPTWILEHMHVDPTSPELDLQVGAIMPHPALCGLSESELRFSFSVGPLYEWNNLTSGNLGWDGVGSLTGRLPDYAQKRNWPESLRSHCLVAGHRKKVAKRDDKSTQADDLRAEGRGPSAR